MIQKKDRSPLGRPPKPINYDRVVELARLQCTLEEIAIALGFSGPWFVQRRKEDPLIDDAIARGRQLGKESLRRKQFEIAMDGDRQLLIHLGKHWLEQNDKIKLTGDKDEPISVKIDYSKLSEKELEEIEEKLSKAIVSKESD